MNFYNILSSSKQLNNHTSFYDILFSRQLSSRAIKYLWYKFWGNTKQGLLPEEYTQVDYIESTGTQYIDTGINADTKLRTILDISFINPTSANQTMGAINIGTPNKRYHLLSGSNSIAFWINNTNYTIINTAITDRHLLDLNVPEGKVVIDETTTTTIPTNIDDTELNFWLFGRNSNSTQYKASFKLWACKMYYNGTLVRDFIPCYRKSDNEVGMYDLVNNVFYANEGTGSFTYGRVAPTPSTPIEVKGVGDKTNNVFDGVYTKAYVDTVQYKFINRDTNANSAVIRVKPNTTYTIQKYENSNRFLIGTSEVAPQNNTDLVMINTDNSLTKLTFTTNNVANYLVIYVSTGAEGATPKIMLSESKNLWNGSYFENMFFSGGIYTTPTLSPRNVIYIPVIGGETYTFSINSIAEGTSFQSVCSINKPDFGVSYRIDEESTFVTHGSVTTFTRTMPAKAKWWAIQIMSLDNLNNNIMISRDSTALPYEPYGYKIPIVVDMLAEYDVISNSTITDEGTWIKYDGTDKVCYIEVQPNTEYHFDLNINYQDIFRVYSNPTDKIPQEEQDVELTQIIREDNATSSKYIFTTPANCKQLVVQVSSSNFYTILNNSNIYNDVNTKTIYLNEPLNKIGDDDDYADVLSHWYSGDNVVRRIKKLVFDGTENWGVYSGDGFKVFYLSDITDYLKATAVTSICTHYNTNPNVPSASQVQEGVCFITISSAYRLYIRDSGISSVNDLRSYLAQQYANGTPVTLWYVLEKPEIEQIETPELPLNDAYEMNTEVQPSLVDMRIK